jgi:cell division inhibitor SepF
MSFWDNVKKITQPYASDDYDDFDDNEALFSKEAPARTGRRIPQAPGSADFTTTPAPEDPTAGSKVVSTGSNKPGVVLFRPITFGDAVNAANELRDRKAIIVNLENTDRTIARRVVDFLSGCSYALDGQVKKIAGGTYLFCPHNMDIAGDMGGHSESDGYL